MTQATHQTVRLSRGKHRSPDEGACVMELASMLAGEGFSDAPRSVCGVLASFMRTYNDCIDDERRQDLYAYAARAVGTAGGREDRRRRAELCRDVLDALEPRGWRPLTRRLHLDGGKEMVAMKAARALAARRERHELALVFMSALIGGRERDKLRRSLAAATSSASRSELSGSRPSADAASTVTSAPSP